MSNRILGAAILAALGLVAAAPSISAQEAGAKPAGQDAPKKRDNSWQKAYQAGMQATEAKDWETAITELQKVVDAEGAPPMAKANAHYNMGCASAQLGRKEKAVEHVVAAIDGGFYDFDHISSDEDLKSVHGDAKIADAMKRNQAKKDAAEAEQRKQAETMRKQWDEKMMADLPAALEKLKDAKGAGFDFAFDVKTLDGRAISSKSIAGKVAIVDIWGTWCPPCRMEIPNFIELAKRHAKDDFVMLGLNDEDRQQNKDAAGSAKKAADFAKKEGINYPLALIDTKTFKQVPNFEGYPTTLFVDRKGTVRLVEVGYHPAEYMDAIVKALLAEGAGEHGGKDRAKEKEAGGAKSGH